MKFFEMNKLIEKCKEIQILYPEIIIGGSCALWIYGLRLWRYGINGDNLTDIDLITHKIIDFGGVLIKDEDSDPEDRTSGSDFVRAEKVDGIKIEQALITHSESFTSYREIEYDKFKFKVNKLENILSFKAKYAQQGNEKQIMDLYEMLNLPKPKFVDNTKIVEKYEIF